MAKRKSSPNGIIGTTTVWDAASDTYSHDDIKGWLDRFDQVIGSLLADRVPLGAITAFSFPDKVAPDGTTVSIPAGWALCDGSTLTSSQHDFPEFAGVSVVLPDYRNRVLVGASSAGLRVAGTVSTTPGIKGRQGANTAVVPDHHHRHNHIHQIGDGSSNGALTAGQNDAHDAYTINTDASGTGHNVALISHEHVLFRQYTTNPHDPANASKRFVDIGGSDASLNAQIQTSKQIASTGGTAEVPTPATGPGDDLAVDTYQQSEGVYYIMKVKLAGNFTKPWTIRDSASSTTTVGS